MVPQIAILVRRFFPFALVTLCLGLASCASLGKKPETEKADSEPTIGEAFRKPGPPGQLLGIDDRAREIERNLGVR